MPRPKSEITRATNMCVRLTNEQKDMFKVLGGAEWLRNYINRQIKQEQIQLGISVVKETKWNSDV
jgi:hypothetical protein